MSGVKNNYRPSSQNNANNTEYMKFWKVKGCEGRSRLCKRECVCGINEVVNKQYPWNIETSPPPFIKERSISAIDNVSPYVAR